MIGVATANLTRQAAVKLAQAGSKAAADGKAVTSCPHKPNASSATERMQAAAWLRGYASAK